LQIQTRVRFKLNSVSRDNSIRCFWFHSKHHLGKLAANSSSWTSGGCWYSTLLSSPTPPPLLFSLPSTSPRRHTRLVGSSLQLFVQAGALLWARSRAFLGVNFNESGTAFAYQRRFTCIQGVLGQFPLPSDPFILWLTFLSMKISNYQQLLSN